LSIADARQVVARAITARIFPAATVEMGQAGGSIWSDALGTLTFDVDAAAAVLATPFDLASLTKVIATTQLILQLVDRGSVRLDERIGDSFLDWRGADREAVTVRDLLEHSSGLPARLLDAPPAGRREFEYDICTMPLEYAPRTLSIYSDLGFILLGFLIADRGAAPLATQFDGLMARLKLDFLGFDPRAAKSFVAPTLPLDDDPRRGRPLKGEVHDAYAAALGGAAGHAGLFGTASAVGAFASAVLRAARGDASATAPWSADCVAVSTTRSTVPGSSRALGWDTMLPTSSCGTRMSPGAFGHVGFTGTSLWIDPARDRYYVLLTNRACGGGSLDEMRTVRRAFHDALADV
jgi:CubicO group peptidase (beta-lactamase class C family)